MYLLAGLGIPFGDVVRLHDPRKLDPGTFDGRLQVVQVPYAVVVVYPAQGPSVVGGGLADPDQQVVVLGEFGEPFLHGAESVLGSAYVALGQEVHDRLSFAAYLPESFLEPESAFYAAAVRGRLRGPAVRTDYAHGLSAYGAEHGVLAVGHHRLAAGTYGEARVLR